jgi:hypothetical protein
VKRKKLINGGDPEQKFIGPGSSDFGDSDFFLGDDIKQIAQALIESVDHFADLADARIVYLWKRKGSERPRRILGKCQRPSGLLGYFSGADFVIWLAANNCIGLTKWQVEALIFHELNHASMDQGEATLVPHDCECFASEIKRYGLWKTDIEHIAEATNEALKLPFEIVVPAAKTKPSGEEAVQ